MEDSRWLRAVRRAVSLWVQEADENFFENFTALSWKQENKRLQAARVEEAEKDRPPPEETDVIVPVRYTIGKKEWEELYVEVLYTIKHKLGGSSSGYATYTEDLYEYAQEAFCMPRESHERLMAIAQEEKPPIPVVYVTVVEAQGLEAKDPNGFSDPYCMLGIQIGMNAESHRSSSDDDSERGRSSPRRQGLRKIGASFKRRTRSNSISGTLAAKFIRTTTVKPQTLNPKWNEKFCLDVEDISSDRLHLDIWDHDDESSVFDAARKLNEISGLKGLGRYFKEIAQSARTSIGDNVDDFLGCVNISLQNLPSSRVDKWFPLQGRSYRSTVQGQIHLRLQLGTREDRGLAATEDNWMEVVEHQQLLWIFIEHELSQYKGPSYEWPGDLPQQALTILHQHAVQGDITELQQTVCQWVMYSCKHREISLDYALLLQLLDELDRAWNGEESLSQDEEAALAESFNLFVDYCMELLLKHRELFPPVNAQAWHKLKFMLKCLSLLHKMSAFKKCCPFRNDLHVEISSILKKGTVEWFNKMHAYSLPQQKNDQAVLNSLIELTEILNRDLQKAVMHYNHLFESTVGVNYAVVVYKQLEKLLSDEVTRGLELEVEMRLGSDIEEVCSRFGNSDIDGVITDMKTGTIIFELYMILQEFARFKDNLPVEERENLTMANFYLWFTDAIHHWFTVAKNKARQRIQKAVELDKKIQFVDTCVNYSTSAVDTATCFAQIKEFWRQLMWPDTASSYAIVIKVIEAICGGAVFYASLCYKQLLESGYYNEDGQFDVSDQVCITINNIEHVQREIRPLETKLEIEKLIHSVEERKGEHSADHCRNSIYGLLRTTEEEMISTISRIIQGIGERMRTDVKKDVFHLAWAPEKLPAEKAIAPLMDYLDENLKTLYGNLLRPNFYRVLEELWRVVLQELTLTTYGNIGKEKCPFFQRLFASLNFLVDFFYGNGNGLSLPVIQNTPYQELHQLLTLHKTESAKLIELFCIQKVEQQSRAPAKYGFLTVKAFYNTIAENVCVNILNARELIPLDPNGFSDPFVIVELQPKHFFPNCEQLRTKVQKKTLFPLFDESFEFHVPVRECRREAAVISFVVMDHDIMMTDDFEGEAYIPLSTLPAVHGEHIKSVKAVELILMHPTTKSDIISVLESRTWDKLAQDCVKQERIKRS